jgi:OmpA-OmpF porin, OOP family
MHGLFRWRAKWWPGVVPLVILWIFAVWSNMGAVEADLSARSTAALKDAVLDKTRVSVEGRDVAIAADAFSDAGRRSAVA